jgi:nucleotide-binding universal stress UspA family protein
VVYGPVVVGVDDLEHSRRTLDVAAREAQMREVPLWLVHAYRWISPVVDGGRLETVREEAARGEAEALLDDAAALVHVEYPTLAVEKAPMCGPAAEVLVEGCPAASLIVVGDRGRGGFVDLTLGTVALRAVTRTHVPTMVVRGAEEHGARYVLVGVDVDDPASGPDLLEFAFTEAELRGVGLYAVHAWEDDRHLHLTGNGQYAADRFRATAADRDRRLRELLSPWQEKFPDVRFAWQVFAGSPTRVLVESSRAADVVVLGGRVRSEGRDGLRVGALVHAVLHHAHCPVVVVPER